MKQSFMALFAFVLVSGCGVELMTTTATQATLEAQQAQAMKGQVARVSNQSGRMSLEHAIQLYKAEKGSNPASLDDLVPNYLPVMPKRADGTPFGYDSATGAVLDGPAAPAASAAPTASTAPATSAAASAIPAYVPPDNAITQQDKQTMQDIREAITKYGTATGYYPGTLDVLYPQYLLRPPRTSAGQPFLYNNQNGTVTHPRQAASAAPAAQPTASAGGAGPLGQVTTGIGMQQQLDGANNSGASSAQGYMNRSLKQSAGGQTDRQNKAMDQLGL